MRLIFLGLMYALTASATVPERFKNYIFQDGCTLYDIETGRVPFPGSFCQFFADGSFISASETAIRRFSPDKQILWEVPEKVHHQMNLSPDRNRILALTSSAYKAGDKVLRSDKVLILGVDGKVIHSRDARDILKEAGLPELNWSDGSLIFRMGATHEISHFNSIYEIPENLRSKEHESLRAGNIIVNGLTHGIFILSSDLKRLISHFTIPTSWKHYIHDVQINAKGELLYFNNWAGTGGLYRERYSSVAFADPLTRKVSFSYTANPKEMFFSASCGSVQEIDDDLIFFSHVTTGGYFYSRKQKTIVYTIPGKFGQPWDFAVTQDIKIIAGEEFLKNSK